MPEKKRPKPPTKAVPAKAKPAKAAPAKTKPAAKAKANPAKADDGFLAAFEALLKLRKLKVPAGLKDAPPEAYARQPASFVQELAKHDDSMLVAQAERIAGYVRRAAERAAGEWDRSALIGEIRRRKLPEPAKPKRVVGAVFALKKPLSEWSDRELVEAATEWSMRANKG